MEQVDEVVGNVTSWFRRFVMSALEHQHAPLPQDDMDEGVGRTYRFSGMQDESPWWLKWSSTAPPGYDHRAPQLHDQRSDGGSQGQGYGGRYDDERGSRYGYDEYARDRPYDREREEEEERERERAERIRREEEEERARRKEEEEAEAAAAAEAEAAAAAAAPPPDLLSMEDDLLGLGTDAGVGALVLYTAPTSDDLISKAFQQEISLLDIDTGTSEASLLEKVNSVAPKQANGEVDLLALVDGPVPAGAAAAAGGGLGGGLDATSGALVLVTPMKGFHATPTRHGVCGACDRSIDAGRYLIALNRHWHPACFKCCHCRLPVTEMQCSVKEGDTYHTECYRQLFHPKCYVCDTYMAPNDSGMVEYRLNDLWHSKHCTKHSPSTDGSPLCSACTRLQPSTCTMVDIGGNRALCPDCNTCSWPSPPASALSSLTSSSSSSSLGAVVVDASECAPLFASVLSFFEEVGLGAVLRGAVGVMGDDLPVVTADVAALQAAAGGERQGASRLAVVPGVCLTQDTTIETVVRAPGSAAGGAFGGIASEPKSLARVNSTAVSGIVILYGLPAPLAGAVIANQLMRAWFLLDGAFSALPSEIEEAMCQVMAHLWLQRYQQQLKSPSPFQSGFLDFCLNRVASDPSPALVDSFRSAYSAVVFKGLLATIQTLRMSNTLPAI